jgi:hypothetical protein
MIRLCSDDSLALGKTKGPDRNSVPGLLLSGKRDSNSRPQPWQGCALPTELFPQNALSTDRAAAPFFRSDDKDKQVRTNAPNRKRPSHGIKKRRNQRLQPEPERPQQPEFNAPRQAAWPGLCRPPGPAGAESRVPDSWPRPAPGPGPAGRSGRPSSRLRPGRRRGADPA